MPLIMDDDMDIDDLFGDGAGLSMPARPPTRELIQRVNDMRRTACNKKVTWSKTGLIASVNSSGFGLELRNIRCHPDHGSWDLSEPTVIQQLNGTGPLQHLCCSSNGNEIAVVDAIGRVSIIQIFNAVNKPNMLRSGAKDQVDDLHALAGCHWLNQVQRSVMQVFGPAVQDGNKYRYDVTQIQTPPLGPVHPVPSQSALMCLTINGLLRLFFPQPKGGWHEARLEVESIVSSDDLISHVAFCSEKNGTLLIAYASMNKQLRLVRASIDWGLPADMRQGPPPMFNPKIEVDHLVAGSWMTSEAEEDLNSKFSMGNSSHTKSSMVHLTYLEILPSVVERTGEISAPPTIIAVRSHLPSSTSYNQEVYSTLDRWSFHESTQSLHPAFEQLSLRRSSTGSITNNAYRQLKTMTCLTVDKIILSVQYISTGKMLCITYSDGSIEYRDRATLTETTQQGNEGFQSITHPSQAGFSYTTDEPCLELAMSPTFCSAALIDNAGKIKWKRLRHDFNQMVPIDLQRNAANAALTVCCANALHNNATIDDLLDIVFRCRDSQDLSFQTDLPPELTRILSLRVDFSTEQHYDALVRNSLLHNVLGFQNSLGFTGSQHPRSFSSKFAWIALHIRHVVVIATMAAQYKVRAPDGSQIEPLLDPEIVMSLSGMMEWSLNLMAWIMDTLLQLRDVIHSANYDLNALNKILSDTRIPSLHLLLSSSTRGLLISLTRRIAHLDYIARKAISPPHAQATPPPLREAYRQIATLTSVCLIKNADFESVLSSLDTNIRESYSNANLGQTPQQTALARNAMETKLLLCFPIPPVFKSVAETLFKETLPKILNELGDGVAELWFGGWGGKIGVDEGNSNKEGLLLDGFYKKWIKSPFVDGGDKFAVSAVEQGRVLRIKRCMRCAIVTEDSMVPKYTNQWLLQQQRRCACGGYWNLLVPGKRIA